MASQPSGSIVTTLAANLRAARAAAGMTQRAVSEALDVDQMMVSKWERGWHRPSDANLMRLADAFGVSVAWLYTEHDKAAA